MNLFIPFLMLTVPGIIAVSVHDKQLIHIRRDNWQSIIWKYLFYSLGIVFTANFVMFLSSPDRTVSYSPCTLWTTNDVLHVGFICKYIMLSVTSALVLPKLWERRNNFFNMFKKNESFKIADDE
jgi:hypothetical protein